MEHYEEVLKLLHDQFDWKLTDSLTTTGKKLVADTIKALKIAENTQALQLQQTGVSGSIYGYALEIIAKDYKGSWFKHYNHKLYETEDSAKNAIEQMKDFIFYSDFEWRIVPIYCH